METEPWSYSIQVHHQPCSHHIGNQWLTKKESTNDGELGGSKCIHTHARIHRFLHPNTTTHGWTNIYNIYMQWIKTSIGLSPHSFLPDRTASMHPFLRSLRFFWRRWSSTPFTLGWLWLTIINHERSSNQPSFTTQCLTCPSLIIIQYPSSTIFKNHWSEFINHKLFIDDR